MGSTMAGTGWMALAKALEGAGQGFDTYRQLKQQALQQSLLQKQDEREAATLKLKQDEAAAAEQQRKFTQDQTVWDRLPEDTPYQEGMFQTPQIKAAATFDLPALTSRVLTPKALGTGPVGPASMTAVGIGPGDLPAKPAPVPTIAGTEGFSGAQGVADPTKMVRATETAASRAALYKQAASDQAKAARQASALQTKLTLEKQRETAARELEGIRQAGANGRMTQQMTMRAQELQLGIAKLDVTIQEANDALGLRDEANDIARYRASNAANGIVGAGPTTTPLPPNYRPKPVVKPSMPTGTIPGPGGTIVTIDPITGARHYSLPSAK